MAAFKILLMFVMFTAISAPPPADICEPDIGKTTVQDCDQSCNESGKKMIDHDCIVRQCQEACKKAGGDEVIWYQYTPAYNPNNYQCCKSKTPEQVKQTKPSCATCKLVNELTVVLG